MKPLSADDAEEGPYNHDHNNSNSNSTNNKINNNAIRYRRLSITKEIRLLEIQPARKLEDPLVCRTVTVPLVIVEGTVASRPDFIGISALPGDPAAREAVHVDGKVASVTAHQAEALRYARGNFLPPATTTTTSSAEELRRRKRCSSPQSPAPVGPLPSRSKGGVMGLHWRIRQLLRLPPGSGGRGGGSSGSGKLRVWLDSVCINGADAEETARRREMMKLAYQSARMVVGWLGPKTGNTDAGLRVFSEIDEAMPRSWGDVGDQQLHPENYAPKHQWAKSIKHIWEDASDGVAAFFQPHWVGANDFMARPYLQRQWVVQELALAAEPAFMVGDGVVSWITVLRLVQAMEDFRDYESEQFPPNYRAMIASLQFGTTYELLQEYGRRRRGLTMSAAASGAPHPAAATDAAAAAAAAGRRRDSDFIFAGKTGSV